MTMDSLKFHLGLPCPTLLRLTGGPPLKRPYSLFRGRPPAAVFYPFGHPRPYAFEEEIMSTKAYATILITAIVNKAIRFKSENDLTNLNGAQDASNCMHGEIDCGDQK
jgi:hypothetical protein